MISWQFDSERNLLIADYTGEVTLDQIKRYTEELVAASYLPRDLRALERATEGVTNMGPDDLAQVIDYWTNWVYEFSSIRGAMVQDKPRETELVLTYIRSLPFAHFQYRVFPTEAQALAWLLSKEEG
jgi:hypothetical protein